MIFIGIATSITTNFFLIFFNWVGHVLLFILFMLHQFYNDYEWEFPKYAKNLFSAGFGWIGYIATPFVDGKNEFTKKKHVDKRNQQTTKSIIVGLFISMMLLIIVLPLLLSSDIVFTSFFNRAFSILSIRNLDIETPILMLVFFLVGYICCYSFFKMLCKSNFNKREEIRIEQSNPIIGITINSVLTFVYGSYCLVQILYLFIGLENGLPIGVTYSEYARSGFWELLFVSLINFFLVVICTYVFKENKMLKILLIIISGCTFIMIGSSAYRMILYVKQYHLTFLRVLVLWFLIVEAIFMIGVILSIFKRQFPLFRYIVLAIMCCYIVLNYARPDVLIAKYNLSQQHVKSTDIIYLLDTSSYDAISVLAEFDMEKVEYERARDEEELKSRIEGTMKYISETNKGIYFRKANYSRIVAKLVADKYY